MLRAVKITKTYPGEEKGRRKTAVSELSLTLLDNSITAVVGESGSGKSTLARLLSFVEAPDSGAVYLDDHNLTVSDKRALRSLRGRVQLVMQDAASSLDPHQRAESILEEPLKLLKHMEHHARAARVSELFQTVQLSESLRKRRVSELSGGQQKRLCIARALAADPAHILFDESFSGLDVTLKKQVLDLLLHLQQEQHLSFLIITHDLDTAMYMADRIYVMRRSKIIETVEHPKSFSDFTEVYSRELVSAVLYKRAALQ